MRALDIIAAKRDGQPISADDLHAFVAAYTRGDIPDYQAAAWLMAVYLRGMSREETAALTLAMAQSGETLDLSDISPYIVDKHSSGGVGDKTTLIVLPLVAACGVPVAKMSGRGLGFTGGTIDKLESLSGFQTDLSADEFRRLAREVGIVLTGQSVALAPADGKLYALRDVTATVSSLPLIASSIMSKKIAAGAHGIVLDVKVGSGAFMKNLEDARALAQMMVEIGRDNGRDVVAALSDMNQPLGAAVGNALEVAEAIEVMNGGGAADLREHCLQIAAHMLRLAGQGTRWTDAGERRALLEAHLTDGGALAKFRAMVAAQGGDVALVDDPARLPTARLVHPVTASSGGTVRQVVAIDIASAAFELGAGREQKGDPVDLAVGLRVHVKVGDTVSAGEPLVTLYANDEARLARAIPYVERALQLVDTPVEPLPLFYDVIG